MKLVQSVAKLYLHIYMKILITTLSLFLLFACNDSVTKSTPTVSKAKIKTASSEQTSSSKVSNDTSVTLDFLMGKFEPKNYYNFLQIEKKYADRKGMFIQKETYEAFKNMYAAAKQDGISFVIKSATRNFISQKNIWVENWNGKSKTTGVKDIIKNYPIPTDRALKILEFSSMPGTSRHHWGTDIDLNNFTNKYFEKGKGKEEYDWLKNNASKFGFYQPYIKKGNERPHGYNEEKWHWSYLPLSKKYIDQVRLKMKDKFIKGFDGAEVAEEIGMIEKYILGINRKCL
jgi:D-alanyl-D-alanine carboxypeptidase